MLYFWLSMVVLGKQILCASKIIVSKEVIGEMAQWVRPLLHLAEEDFGSHNPHQADHNPL